MNRSIHLFSALSAFALVALGAPAPASAATDYKVFSTMNCVPNSAASSNDLTYSYLGILNTSATENRVVICPLVKDSDAAIFNSAIGELTFSYRTPMSSTGVVNCTVQVGHLGSEFYSASTSNAVQPANSYRESSLPVHNPDNYLRPINLVCTLSPRMRLLRIIVNETTITNTP